MRKAIVAVVVLVVLAILAGAMFVLNRGGAGSRAEASDEQASAAAPPAAAEGERGSSPAASPPSAKRARPEAVAEREAMRRRILETLHARERAAAERESATWGGDAPQPELTAPPQPELTAPDDGPTAVGTVVDKTGNHAEHVKVVNEELIPLTDECYALARETQPELAGMLVLDFEIIGDEDIGGVIESVGLGQGNELLDAGLIECVQESILSVTLPPPVEGGRDEISLSLRLAPDEE